MQAVNQAFLAAHSPEQMTVEVIKIKGAQAVNSKNTGAKMDEVWSYVGCKNKQSMVMTRHRSRDKTVLAYVLGSHEDRVFLELKSLLEPFGISRFYTDDWGAYQRHLDAEHPIIGKKNTQRIERKHLTLLTRIKRLARKTICFSKIEKMHDIVIGLFVNHYEFGLNV